MNDTILPSSTLRPPATVEIQYILAFSYLILSVIGIIPNVTLMIVLAMGIDIKSPQLAFFSIALMITLCDTVRLFTRIVAAFPLSMWGEDFYSGALEQVDDVMLFMDTFWYGGMITFIFLMTLNRFTVFIFPTVNEFLFEKKRVFGSVLFVWLLCFIEQALTILVGCHTTFKQEEFFFTVRCTNLDKYPMVTDIFFKIMVYRSFVFPAFMFSAYLIVFVHIRSQFSSMREVTTLGNKDVQKHKIEINMLIQGGIICGSILFLTVSEELKLSFTGYGFYWSSFVRAVLEIFNSSNGPYVYLYFNVQLRTKFFEMFGMSTETKLVSVPPSFSSGASPKAMTAVAN